LSPFVRDPEVEAAASTRVLVLLYYSMLAGQQPPRVAWVCVRLALFLQMECGRTAALGCSWFERPRCNALRDAGLGGRCRMALEPRQGSAAQASGE